MGAINRGNPYRMPIPPAETTDKTGYDSIVNRSGAAAKVEMLCRIDGAAVYNAGKINKQFVRTGGENHGDRNERRSVYL
jgi:hypothetical protein